MAMTFTTLSGEHAFGPYDWARPFAGGLATVQVGKLFGAIDDRGAMVIEPRFATLHRFSEGLAAARLPGGRMGYVDTTGAWAIEPRWDFAIAFTHGLGAVVSGGHIDDGARMYRELPSGGNWGAVNAEGTVVVPLEHAYLAAGDELILVNQGGRSGTAGAIGGVKRYLRRTTLEPIGYYVGATPCHEGLALARPKGKPWTILGGDGMPRGTVELGVAPERVSGHAFSQRRAYFTLPGAHENGSKYVLIDDAGTVVLRDLGYCPPFKDGVATINIGGEAIAGPTRGGTWGFVDLEGTIVSRPEWKQAIDFAHGIGIVDLGKGNGLRAVDRKGDGVLDIASDWARVASAGFLLVKVAEPNVATAAATPKPRAEPRTKAEKKAELDAQIRARAAAKGQKKLEKRRTR
jgi:hypothetical protein